jgi:hypothetical protein
MPCLFPVELYQITGKQTLPPVGHLIISVLTRLYFVKIVSDRLKSIKIKGKRRAQARHTRSARSLRSLNATLRLSRWLRLTIVIRCAHCLVIIKKGRNFTRVKITTCSGLPRLVEYLGLVSVVGGGGRCGQVEKVG